MQQKMLERARFEVRCYTPLRQEFQAAGPLRRCSGQAFDSLRLLRMTARIRHGAVRGSPLRLIILE